MMFLLVKKGQIVILPNTNLKTDLLLGGDGTPLINGLTNDIHDPAQGLWTHWDSNGSTGVQNLLSTDQTLSTIHGDGTHCVLP